MGVLGVGGSGDQESEYNSSLAGGLWGILSEISRDFK